MRLIKQNQIVRRFNHQIRFCGTVIIFHRMIHGASMAQIAFDKKDFNNG